MAINISYITIVARDFRRLSTFYRNLFDAQPQNYNSVLLMLEITFGQHLKLAVIAPSLLSSYVSETLAGEHFRNIISFNISSRQEAEELVKKSLKLGASSIAGQNTDYAVSEKAFFIADPENNIIELHYST